MSLLINEFNVDKLRTKVFESRRDLGIGAAHDVVEKINELLRGQKQVNMIFAAAPSQSEFLETLSEAELDWGRINAFHMDEYIGLAQTDPGRFGNYLKKAIFEKVPFGQIFYLNGSLEGPYRECQRYADLLMRYPPDIVCLGIGENTHLAFNDPHVADFEDPLIAKVVELDTTSRQQQVNDGCFKKLADVPKAAITLTIPTLMKTKYVFCMVPGSNKADAVRHTLRDKISKRYPSTTLRNHDHAVLYLNKDSAAKI